MIGDPEDRTISGAARVEIEVDQPAGEKSIPEFIREELRPSLQELEDQEGVAAIVLLAAVDFPDGRRVWTWAQCSANDAPYMIDACLSSMGRIIRGADARAVAEEVDQDLRKGDGDAPT